MNVTEGVPAASSRLESWIALAGLLLLAFVIYMPALHGEFIWDDDAYVSENPLLHDADGLVRIWTTTETPQYYPMVFTSFWVENHLWGLDPTGYHVVNVLLHALSAWLIGLILRSLGLRWGWWVAFLFVAHPVHVESVAWITERKNVLSALFYLSALLAYLRFETVRRKRFYGIALLLFVCALLSKTVTSTLPVVLLLVLWYRNKKLDRDDWIHLLPFFAVALAMGLVTVRLEEGIVDPVRAEFAFTWLERGCIAVRGLVFYAGKLLWPHPLSFNYPRWSLDLAAWPFPVSMLVVLVAAALLVVGWRRGYRGAVLAVVYFVITLFPALGLFNVYPFRYSFVADHFQYLASVGMLVLLVGTADLLAERVGARAPGKAARGDAVRRPRGARVLCRVVGVIVVVALAVTARNQAGAYRDMESLWRDTIAKNPGSWIAHNNLAGLLLERGETDAALAEFDQAVASNPRSAESLTGRAMTRARLGSLEPALADFDRALELDPTYPQAYINRGELLLALGRHELAIDDLTRVLGTNPDYLDAYRIRSQAYLALGSFEPAIADLTEAIDRGAGVEAVNDRGIANLRAGRVDPALTDFEQALRLAPERHDIRHNQGVALARAGRIDEALEVYGRVLEADPRALNTWLMRGRLYLEQLHDRSRACQDWRNACRLGDCRLAEEHCEV